MLWPCEGPVLPQARPPPEHQLLTEVSEPLGRQNRGRKEVFWEGPPGTIKVREGGKGGAFMDHLLHYVLKLGHCNVTH